MSVKISIFKSTADGEQLNQEYNVDKHEFARMEKGETLREIFAPYLKFADQRLLECNLRIIIANKMVKALPVEAQMAVHNVMEVLHGQRPTIPEYAEILQKAIGDMARDLVQQGISEKQIRQIVTTAYGKDAYPAEAPAPVLENVAPIVTAEPAVVDSDPKEATE